MRPFASWRSLDEFLAAGFRVEDGCRGGTHHVPRVCRIGVCAQELAVYQSCAPPSACQGIFTRIRLKNCAKTLQPPIPPPEAV